MYKKWITVKKMVYQAVIVAGSAFITAMINAVQELPADQAGIAFMLLLVLLKGGENYLKHRNDR